MATPNTVNPRAPYLFCSSISQGISILHGPHQVAQKFTKTTLPLNRLRETSWSSRSFKVKSGEAVGLSGYVFAARAGGMRVARFANKAKATIPASVARINPMRFNVRLLTTLDSQS